MFQCKISCGFSDGIWNVDVVEFVYGVFVCGNSNPSYDSYEVFYLYLYFLVCLFVWFPIIYFMCLLVGRTWYVHV